MLKNTLGISDVTTNLMAIDTGRMTSRTCVIQHTLCKPLAANMSRESIPESIRPSDREGTSQHPCPMYRNREKCLLDRNWLIDCWLCSLTLRTKVQSPYKNEILRGVASRHWLKNSKSASEFFVYLESVMRGMALNHRPHCAPIRAHQLFLSKFSF